MSSQTHPTGIQWAPAQLPLERRLQTAAIVFALALFPICCSLIALLWFWQPLVRWYSREMLFAYVVFIVFDKAPTHGGRVSLWARNWRVWKLAASFFPAHLHVPPGGYDKSKPHLVCLHPHGIISVSAVANLLWNANNAVERIGFDYRIGTVTFNFIVPIWREILMALGFISASKESILRLLNAGKSAMIVIGGAQETLYAKPGSADLVLGKRKGFIKLALKSGASLVPVYHFGEVELFDQLSHPTLLRIQNAIIRLTGFTVPLVRGRGIFQYSYGIIPRRHPLHTVMGPAIPVQQVLEPTDAQVDELHTKYVAALEALYNEHKDKYISTVANAGGEPSPKDAPPLRIVA